MATGTDFLFLLPARWCTAPLLLMVGGLAYSGTPLKGHPLIKDIPLKGVLLSRSQVSNTSTLYKGHLERSKFPSSVSIKRFHCINLFYLYIYILYIYTYKAEILSVTLFITRHGLLTSPYQLPNSINPSCSSFKLITASKCGDQLRSTAAWRRRSEENSSNIPSKTTAIWLNRQRNWLAFRRSWVRIQLVNRFFFFCFEYQYFCKHVF